MRRKVGEKRVEVGFKLEDVLYPDQDVVMAHLSSGVEVVGKVSFFSDSGTEKEGFAIVEVPGMMVPLVVPRERLRSLSGVRLEPGTKKSLSVDAWKGVVKVDK
jgi:hypothetical protein